MLRLGEELMSPPTMDREFISMSVATKDLNLTDLVTTLEKGTYFAHIEPLIYNGNFDIFYHIFFNFGLAYA
jgi:hypothetical protein